MDALQQARASLEFSRGRTCDDPARTVSLLESSAYAAIAQAEAEQAQAAQLKRIADLLDIIISKGVDANNEVRGFLRVDTGQYN